MTLLLPANESVEDTSVIFQYNVSDNNNITNCSLWGNWSTSAGDVVSYYNFSGISYPTSTHNATYGKDTSLPVDGLIADSETEFGSGTNGAANNYTQVSVLGDGNYAVHSTKTGGYAIHKFRFELSESEASVSEIGLSWNGTGGVTSTGPPATDANFSIWNSTGWENLGSCALGVTDPLDYWCHLNFSINTNIANYINETDNNAVYVLAQSQRVGSGGPSQLTSWIYTDFIELNVTSTSSASWSINQTNTVIVNNATNNFTVTNFSEGSYLWNVQCYNNYSLSGWGLANLTFQVNSSIISIALSFSDALSNNINWTVVSVPVVNLSANGNNDTGVTQYDVLIDASGTTVDLYMKADSNLTTGGGDSIGLSNETFAFNTTNSTVPSDVKRALTLNYADNLIGENLANGTYVYLKFFLNVPASQPPGTYSNNVSITAVPYGDTP